MKAELYERITHQIITAVEAGPGTYRMPWHSLGGIGTPRNAISGRGYRGINTLLLWAEAARAGYASGEWATYRQWAASGAQVRQGARSTLVLLWKQLAGRDDDDAGGDDARHGRFVARAFHVFNADQVEGHVRQHTLLPEEARIAAADLFFQAQPAWVHYDSAAAFFDPVRDSVAMPPFASFVSADAFYAVLAHELTHWTGAKPRLDRDLSGRFGTEAYAMEELVAELGAAFTLGHLGLASVPRDDHAAYISSWLRVLGRDPRAIVTAASRAQAAADYLIACAGPTAEEERPASDQPVLEQAA